MNDIDRMTAWFRSKIGIRETGENEVVFNAVYYGKNVRGPEFPWCCAFIWCGFHELGLDRLFVGGARTAYCPYVVTYAKNAGRWITDHYREGDLLLYDWNTDGLADHIGYCVSWDGHTAAVIEGNCNDAVCEIRRTRDQIMGAYRPNYEAENDGDDAVGTADISDTGVQAVLPTESVNRYTAELPLLTDGAEGDAVELMQLLLELIGYDFPQFGADGEYGDETRYTVMGYQYDQGLEADGECGPKTWGSIIRELKRRAENGTD